ncbi:MAG: DUF2845 domain-containing protein [Deltaproteobacteria bacterium]|nr:DUF2845 domain-containing protein [Deltaproteobacteria bacterium]
MEKTRIYYIVSVILAVILLSDGSAFALRCGNRLVCVGDTKSKMLHLCGEPDNVEIWHEELISAYSYRPYRSDWEYRQHLDPVLLKELITIEKWEYNYGPSRFVRFLIFENGILKRIISGDYGY